jgi:molybdopterin molybdotransferase
MITLDEALQIVLASARPLGTERVELDNALQRVLAEDVASDMDMPPFDKALRDGYACRRADLAGVLTVVETVPAGAAPTRAVGPHQCAKIMTGAVLPPGADCVVMVEQTEPAGRDAIRFTGAWTPDHIARRGDDIARGQVVLKKGCRLGPPHVAVLASVGCVRPLVAARPRVAVIAGGNELVAAVTKPGPAQIRNSNGPQLLAQLAAVGVDARDYGMVRDTVADIDKTLKAALAENDVVVISGGVSVGEFDLIPGVLRQNDVRLLFEKIAVQPGKPTVFGLRGPTYCFGLPGNPVSTFVTFELIVKPFLHKLLGCDYAPFTVEMHLDEGIARENTDRQSWIPVRRTSATTVRAVEYRGSAHIRALCEADGLVHLDIGVARLAKAAPVCVRLLGKTGV